MPLFKKLFTFTSYFAHEVNNYTYLKKFKNSITMSGTWLEWMVQSFCWGGLFYVIYRQFTTKNRVTFESIDKSKELTLRIKTAIFYIPFVSLSTFIAPRCMQAFMTVMIFQGVGEFLDIIIPDRIDPVTKKINRLEHHFSIMDRTVQALSILPIIGFFISHMMATAIFYISLAIIVVAYLVLLVVENKAIERTDFQRLAYYWFAMIWIAWPLSHATVMLISVPIEGVYYGRSILVLCLLVSWSGDIAAYFGSLLYNHHTK